MTDGTGTTPSASALNGSPDLTEAGANGVAPPLSDEDLMALVERYLEPHQPADYRLDLARGEGVRHNGNWHYLVVRPSQSDVRLHDYSTRLAATEDELEAGEHLKVLLVPILPE